MWVFSPKLQCEDEIDRRTDRQTDGRTDFPDSLIVAKKKKKKSQVMQKSNKQSFQISQSSWNDEGHSKFSEWGIK